MGRASRRRSVSRAEKSAGILNEIHSVVGIKVETNAQRITEVQRYQGDPGNSQIGEYVEAAENQRGMKARIQRTMGRRPRGYSDEEIQEFQMTALRASQECNHRQRRMIRSLMGQQLTPREGTQAIRAAMGWSQEETP